MPKTYDPIATYTATGTIASYTFSSIPQTYTDLILIDQSFVASGGSHCLLQFNGDTTSNYSLTALIGDGTSASSARYSNQTAAYISRSATGQNSPMGITHIMNYTNTTTFKTILSKGNVAAGIVLEYVNLWRKTPEAITSLTIAPNGASFTTGSTFTLYGIKAA